VKITSTIIDNAEPAKGNKNRIGFLESTNKLCLKNVA
jgi:hypothetical protein